MNNFLRTCIGLFGLAMPALAASFVDLHDDGAMTGWVSQGQRTWAEKGGIMSPATQSSMSGILIRDAEVAADGVLEAEMVADSWNGQNGGIVFRYKDPQNFYFVSVKTGNQYDQGVYFAKNTLAVGYANKVPGSFAPTGVYKLKVAIKGATFTISVNDVQIGVVTDYTHTAGKVGYGYNNIWDDYVDFQSIRWTEAGDEAPEGIAMRWIGTQAIAPNSAADGDVYHDSQNGQAFVKNNGIWSLFSDITVGPQGPVGLTGATGATGAQGEMGPIGPQGEVGAIGPVGPQGPVGLTGATGATGAQGEMGPIGPQGEVGAIGPVGPQGPVGLTGATGATGAQGEMGPIGPQGPIGLTGAVGAKGDVGATGPVGPQGAAGVPGAKGDVGAVGPVGPQGPIGLTGATGATGAKGDVGAVGPVGPQGPIGLTGATGATGPQGPAGVPGVKGDAGVQGPSGPSGTAKIPFRLTKTWQYFTAY